MGRQGLGNRHRQGVGADQSGMATSKQPDGYERSHHQSDDHRPINSDRRSPPDHGSEREDGTAQGHGIPCCTQPTTIAALGHGHSDDGENAQGSEQHDASHIAIRNEVSKGPKKKAPKHGMSRNGDDGACFLLAAAKAYRERVRTYEPGHEQEEGDRHKADRDPGLPCGGSPEFHVVKRKGRVEDPRQGGDRDERVERQVQPASQNRHETLSNGGNGRDGVQGEEER